MPYNQCRSPQLLSQKQSEEEFVPDENQLFEDEYDDDDVAEN